VADDGPGTGRSLEALLLRLDERMRNNYQQLKILLLQGNINGYLRTITLNMSVGVQWREKNT
jgi:hypothetical protein